jgi:hypothetical protein
MALAEIAAVGKTQAVAKPPRPEVATITAALTSPDVPTSLAVIADTLARLQTAVDDADGGPSADARQGYALASMALTEALIRWKDAKALLAAPAGK